MKNKINKIHFTGVKGVGMAPLAIIAKEAKFDVTGSDVSEVFITDDELSDAGITIYNNFDPKNITGADLVVFTAAHGGMDNVEVKAAIRSGIPALTQGEALGKFQNGEILNKKYTGISVAGSHGKTTTTAMIATVLAENGLDPSYVVGTGNIPSLGKSGHFGRGKHFVVEADEYFADTKDKRIPKFLFQDPQFIVVTNIDFDHPDIYLSIDDIRSVFLQFVGNIEKKGTLVMCGDGEENRRFLKQINSKKITYGLSSDNDFWIERVSMASDKMFFWVKSRDTMLGQFSISVFGEQNATDALAAIVIGLEVGLSVDQIKKGLSKFSGTKRRSEFIGELKSGVKIYDDYAHHPREIKETLSAFKKTFPREKIIVVFQPHMYSRTKLLFKDFSTSFNDASIVLINEIFPSFREKIDKNFSSKLLVEEIKKFGKISYYFPGLDDMVKYLASQKYDRNTIIITMGAGDVYKIGKELLNG